MNIEMNIEKVCYAKHTVIIKKEIANARRQDKARNEIGCIPHEDIKFRVKKCKVLKEVKR